jgi:electron transfer flavoprotein alpha subunit
MKQIFVLLRQVERGIEESGLSLLTSATEIADEVVAVVLWHDNSFECPVTRLRGCCHEAWIMRSESLFHPDAITLGTALSAVVPPHPIFLMHHDSLAMDTGPGVSVILDVPFVSNIVSLESDSDRKTRLVKREYGGQVDAVYEVSQSLGCFITVSAAFQGSVGKVLSLAPRVVEKAVLVVNSRRRWLRNEPADFSDDVDIASVERLLAVGRGMQEPEQIALAEEAALAMAGVVCCSRPVVDAGRLGKSRQVGISGASVSPKIYLACGISGSFQHMAGLRGAPFIIAVNKNPRAPIFERADVGVVADGAEFLAQLVSAFSDKGASVSPASTTGPPRVFPTKLS